MSAQQRARLPALPEELELLDTEKEYGPIAATYEAEPLTEDDMIAYISAGIAEARLIGQNIDSYNELVQNGVRKIVTDMFKIDIASRNLRPSQDQIDHFGIVVNFRDAEIKRPVTSSFPSGQIVDLYPNLARSSGKSYSGPLYMAAEVHITAHYVDGHTETKSADIERFEVSQFPIMVGSVKCHTYNLTREARKQLQEDPREQGGYFIAKNSEWAVELLENIRFNSLHVYLNLGRELVRGEFISQPGGAFENSSQIILRHLQNGMLTIEINSMKFQKLQIPFYLIYRLFGIVSDAEILTSIFGDLETKSPVYRRMIEDVDRALHLAPPLFAKLKDQLDRQVITEELAVVLEAFVTNPHSYRSNEEAVRHLTTHMLHNMDQVFLPHVGKTAADRISKLRFLGMLISKMMLVERGVAPPADRDSLTMKRVHGSGVSLAKAFKAMFNSAVVSVIVSSLKLELKQNDFEKLTPRRIQEASRTMFTASGELNRLLEQSLTSGNRIIMVRRRAMLNRMASNPVERKNPLNLYSALRRITAHNAAAATKGTERAEKIRAVHPDAMGYIDPYHSADTGEKVGMEKQMACTTDVCDAGEAHTLVARLVEDPNVQSLDQVTNTIISQRHLARVFVNGDWIGCCEKPSELVARYRGLRRRGIAVAPRTTISWKIDTNEVEFWLDVGRITRPLLIVDSNEKEYDAACRKAFEARKAGEKDWRKHRIEFVQNVRFTKEHVRQMLAGRLTLGDLVKRGICEYITPEEMENCLLAEDIEHLYRNKNNVLRPYTHCDVPQALCGFASLVSPFGSHTQPARICYETNQGRSTCGWYCGSWPFRADQLRFFQFYNEYPLVKTLSNDVVLPSGMNTMMAYMTLLGDNQEDSANLSQDFAQRGGFGGVLFRKETVTLERGEQFGTPNEATTRSMRAGASYGKLVDGFVRPGTRVEKGDVIIGRLAKEAPSAASREGRAARGQATATAVFTDRSVLYREDEPAIVDNVWSTQAADDSTFAVVKLRLNEPINIGDKMSSRAGNKSIVASVLPATELPYDEEGIRPDILINPHSIPSRMVIGQNIEAYVSQACARTGTVTDGTIFRELNLKRMRAVMKSLGFRESGHRRMFNPHTGKPLEMAIFMGPTYQQRLQKFVDLNRYAAPLSGPVDALTGQPLDGKKARGGLRLGEMEHWVLAAKGMTNVIDQKARADADGRIAYYCRNCGQPADYNEQWSIYNCPQCEAYADIVAVPSKQSSIIFQQEVRSMGIDIRMDFEPRSFDELVS